MKRAARQTLALETHFSLREVQALADVTHDAPRHCRQHFLEYITRRREWLSCPVRLKRCLGLSTDYTDGLLTRAADVIKSGDL